MYRLQRTIIMKIGIQSMGTVGSVPGETPEEGFRKIREAGFEAVDFNFEVFVDSRTQYRSDGSCFFDKPLSELKEYFFPYKEACEKAGLVFSQGHAMFGPYPKTDEEMQQFIKVQKNVIELAGFMNIPCLVIHPWNIAWESGKDAEWAQNLSYFRALAPTAVKCGVVICLENMFIWRNDRVFAGCCAEAEEAVRYLTELNREFPDFFRFCLDVGHANLLGKSLREFVTVLGDHLAILHLHENDGVKDVHGMPFMFIRNWGAPGIQDWKGLIDGLSEIGYDGTLSFETGPVFFSLPEGLHEPARRFMFEIGDYLRSEIRKEKR